MRDVLSAAIERLRGFVSGKRVVPPLPKGRAPALPHEDAPEGGDPAAEAPRIEPLALFIAYVDAKGDRSQRRITVRHLIDAPPTMLFAFCHERRAPRNFRLDRIAEVADAATGEVHDPAALVALLTGAGVATIDPDVRRLVNVLVFLMRCDGVACPAEWAAIDESLARYFVRFGGTDADHAAATRFARRVAPDADDFLIGMRSLTHHPQAPGIARWLHQAIADLIDADGTHADEELYWLAEVRDFLATMAGRGR